MFVYCREAHPDGHLPAGFETFLPEGECFPPLPEPATWEARAARAELFRRTTKSHRRILVDEEDEGSVLTRYGGGFDLIVIVDEHGRIAAKMQSPNARDLEEFLQGMLDPPPITNEVAPGRMS